MHTTFGFSLTLCFVAGVQMLPLATNIREAFKNGQDDEQNFIQNLALFLCTFLKDHAVLIEPKVSPRGWWRDFVQSF